MLRVLLRRMLEDYDPSESERDAVNYVTSFSRDCKPAPSWTTVMTVRDYLRRHGHEDILAGAPPSAHLADVWFRLPEEARNVLTDCWDGTVPG